MAYRSALFNKEPLWKEKPISAIKQASHPQQSWIKEAGSLTRRLKKLCGHEFNVNLQYQHWTRPAFSEQKNLAMRNAELANIREVILQYGTTPLVVARTVIPRQMLNGSLRHLISLGNKPLGEVIFAEPGLTRRSFEVCVFDSGLFRQQSIRQHCVDQRIWGRRSCYVVHGKPILISEIFLPTLLALEADSK
ncbi:MAG: chorismate lyase [Gammaproteobacteria bacterium]|nr:chorismate lyase [Gammaproteobacteria bacterium]